MKQRASPVVTGLPIRNAGPTMVLLAWAYRLRYAACMLPLRLRCVVHFALALTLAVGLAAQGTRAAGMMIKADHRAHAMAAHMGMAAADNMPMCSKCDACKNGSCKGDDGCTSSGACAAYCGNLAALPVLDTGIRITVSESAADGPLPFRLGWDPPPDPYPPRSIILS